LESGCGHDRYFGNRPDRGLRRRDDLVPLTLRAASGAGLYLLCLRSHRDRAFHPAGNTCAERRLRSRLFNGVRSAGGRRDLISRILLSYRYETNIIGGAIIILFGVIATGLVPMPWLQQDIRYHGSLPRRRLPGAYMLGLAFGFGWTPCIGPVLGAILTVSAMSSTATAGIILLTTYSLGLGVPFLLSAAFTERLMRRMGAMRLTGQYLKIGAGGVMIAMGTAMVTGYMSVFSYWLLENFPIFSTIS
jgi:cytochrome c-type biogenesis protein